MHTPLIVVDHLDDWVAFADGPPVISAADYLDGDGPPTTNRVINLCRDQGYQGVGYYVSLLTEARGRRALPNLATLVELGDADHPRERLAWRRSGPLRDGPLPASITIYCGRCHDPRLASLAAAIFQRYPAPILHADLTLEDRDLVVSDVRLGRLDRLDDCEESRFAEALDAFSHRIWRAPKPQRRFDLAILVDPEEAMPPSDRSAIRHFERAGRGLGFAVEVITPADSPRLLEFDALFIRCGTAIDHVTYRLARRAEREGLAVVDDPDSILRCCNKVFLHDLLRTHRVAMPPSALVLRQPATDLDRVIAELGLPLVLKIPDGSFSRGVHRAEDALACARICSELHRESAVILAQAYVPTAFDWRIGVLEGRALYACRYHMAHNHWQVVDHSAGRSQVGGHESVALGRVPATVIRAAVKAARLVGDGFYGVDLKEIGGRVLVIEVNDNPSIDAGVEDEILGEELYRQILNHLLARVQARGRRQ